MAFEVVVAETAVVDLPMPQRRHCRHRGIKHRSRTPLPAGEENSTAEIRVERNHGDRRAQMPFGVAGMEWTPWSLRHNRSIIRDRAAIFHFGSVSGKEDLGSWSRLRDTSLQHRSGHRGGIRHVETSVHRVASHRYRDGIYITDWPIQLNTIDFMTRQAVAGESEKPCLPHSHHR